MEPVANQKRGKTAIDLSLIVPVILALILSVVSFLALRYVVRSKDEAVMNHAPDLIAIQRLVIDSEELHERSEAYLFSSRVWEDPKFYRLSRDRRKEFLSQLRVIRPLLTEEEGRRMILEASRLADEYLKWLDYAIRLRRQGASLSRISSIVDREITPRYAQLMQTLRDLTSFKESLLEEATRSSIQTSLLARRLILLSGLIALFLGTFLSIRFIRRFDMIHDAESSLRDTLQIRDEFLSIASHELKNPVTALLMQIELLARMIRSEQDLSMKAKQRMIAERCLRETRRLASLVEQLLDLTRLRVGKVPLERKSVDLVTIVREVLEAQMAEAQAQGSSIRLEATESAVGFWDPMRISQIAYNLISNAIKYGDGKPIRVRIDNDRVRGQAVLVVQDEGIGIERDMQDKIFKRFERGAVSQKIKGLGLGLYIVRQILDAHGGRIYVRSGTGKGSTFIVTLPYAEGSARRVA